MGVASLDKHDHMPFSVREHGANIKREHEQEYPQMEAIAGSIITGDYMKISKKVVEQDKKGKQKTSHVSLSPTSLRAMSLNFFANNVDSFMLLMSAKDNPVPHVRYDNIQPVVVSFHHLRGAFYAWMKDKGYPEAEMFKPQEQSGLGAALARAILLIKPDKVGTTEERAEVIDQWMLRLNGAIQRAKEGYSDSAVMAAPTGRAEWFWYKLGKMFQPATALLKESGGMFSGMPNLKKNYYHGNIFFATAQNEAFGRDIQLTKGTVAPSAGAVGYVDEVNPTYTVRKLPRHSRAAFATFVHQTLFNEGIDSSSGNAKATIKEVQKYLKAWDKLTYGKLTMDEFDTIKDQVYEALLSPQVCGNVRLEASGIRSSDQLVTAMNTVLATDAQKTIDPQSMERARQLMYEFFEEHGYSTHTSKAA